jgi:hypothetical protein
MLVRKQTPQTQTEADDHPHFRVAGRMQQRRLPHQARSWRLACQQARQM